MAEPMGFYTDTTVCIGCKACEVACKEWNQLPSTNGGVNTLERRQLRQHAPARRHPLAPRQVHRAVPRGPQGRPLAHDERRLQALRPGGVPGGLPDRRDHPHRVRHRRHPVGRLQRLPRLHRRLPVRRHRHQPGLRHRAEVHALLRPAPGRPGAGLLEGLPDPVDPVRHDHRAARKSAEARRAAAPGRREARLPLRRRRQDARRAQLVLPARRQAGGLRPAARPEDAHAQSDSGSLFSVLGAVLVGLIGIFNFRNRARAEREELRP